MTKIIVQTNQLSKVFKKHTAVDRVNLKIEAGEIYGFLGHNGAGKTTTIRMLLGLMTPSSGTIQIFGKELKREKKEILSQIGSLVENPSYYGHLTAVENLEAIRRIIDVPKKRIDEVLSIVRLTKDARRPVKGFSLGMKQRLGIATALLGNPQLLILDEPTNGLDPAGIQEMRELIKELPKQTGMTILISSHLLNEIDQMATQVGIISKGKMLFQDSIDELRHHALNKVALRVSDPVSALGYLLANGVKANHEQGWLYLDAIDDNTMSLLVNKLVVQNVAIYRIEERKQSLEDIFLKFTSGEESL